ncbi:MAG: folate-binding protein YgfZ, partial [Verrucomicrobiales bacterium]|nr:folate-binding protein YgfZ [Verrucomicrobiales bacterium]
LLRDRVAEVLGLHYQAAWPNREFETARGVRRSPLHDRLVAQGAAFGAKAGWERPNWFARSNTGSDDLYADQVVPEYSFERQNWFENHKVEHQAARQKVAIFDQTGFGKLVCRGRDSVNVLQRLCGNNVDVPIGKTVYTGLFNERGGFESDLTVIRTGREEFQLITGTSQPVHDLDWIRRHIGPGDHAEALDITNSLGVLGVMGPNARNLLNRLTDADLTDAAFPFGTSQQISVGWAAVRAVRITYVGELGWELHVPIEQMPSVYDALWQNGEDLGLINAGHYAINSLRLEKSYRAWGAELSPDDSPLEAGLGFAIDWTKAFIGRETLTKQRKLPLKRMLVTFVVNNPAPVLWGSELIYRDEKPVGYTTSGSYGFSVGGAIGMGYVNHPGGVDSEFIKAGRYEIDINGTRFTATPHLRAPYDPARTRILS